ncbi:hypothetical protein GCM10028806_19650 [Spirosoma terrae]|uniref:Uncharacterized protein n=1 Tax=Spirosoma terrae TaxID=1968276 RepID=A0A6L9L8M5_9BACT|nr:hypothetical protein [Spirosoma terrae]NDU94718.1 hypothetical protein [Spirosoma terrae]
MVNLDDLTSQEQDLQSQLEQLAFQKQQAIQAERDEKLGLITVLENEANGYRNQAAKADSDDDKQKLYRFAEVADKQANELKLELGIVSETELQASNEQRIEAQHNQVKRSINSLFLKAFFTLVAFLFADYSSAQLEAGFLAYLLKSAGSICWAMSVALGGCWLACISLFGFVSEYSFSRLRDDFKSLSPSVRLAILAGLLAAFLHFLTAIVPHAH